MLIMILHANFCFRDMVIFILSSLTILIPGNFEFMGMFNECIVTALSFYCHIGLIHDILMKLVASSLQQQYYGFIPENRS